MDTPDPPTTGSPVVLSIPYGAQVRAQLVAVTDADAAEWYEVTYRSETGYVLGSLLSERKPQPRPTPTATPRPPADTWTLTAVGDIMLSRVEGAVEKASGYWNEHSRPYIWGRRRRHRIPRKFGVASIPREGEAGLPTAIRRQLLVALAERS